jgi:hypothetical protein
MFFISTGNNRVALLEARATLQLAASEMSNGEQNIRQ